VDANFCFVRELRIGLQLPTVDAFGTGAFAIGPVASAAEAAGFDAVWVGDHLTFTAPVVEAFVAASTAAASTETVSIGFAVLVAGLRHPAWLAKQLTSLQVVSGGRIVLGVGIGGEFKSDWAAAGVPRCERATRTDALLAALPQLLSGRRTRLDDPWGVEVAPLTPFGARPPLWIGGRRDAALRRAVRNEAGWLGVWQDVASLRERLERLDEIAWEHCAPRPPVGLEVLVHPTREASAGEPQMRAFIESIYTIPFERIARYAVGGEPAAIADHLVGLVEAGVDELILIPAVADPLACMGELADIRERVRTQLAASAAA
jgi:alkanesulfonate monooxygenase SsuD/methylene tetrahydromethanopterin reductase-like flavin-dependent oxidoreductase (luciferase family)